MPEILAPQAAADQLHAARQDRRTIERLTDSWPDLDEPWGYAVQDLDREQRVRAGDPVIGAKLGLTSAAKQQRMSVDRPIVGFLTASMYLRPAEVRGAMHHWAQPRIEPEIAFITSRDISHALTDEDVASAVRDVVIAAEIIDSRWTDYRFRLADVIADNTSAAGVLVGSEPVDLPSAGDLAALACQVEVDGEIVHEATGAAILGHPLRALRLLSEHLERRGEVLPAGSLVLAGALTDAVPLTAGRRYRLSIERLGTIDVTA
ncbi:fumarylacetoacetate hydrolase family protein [Nocardioides dubius]|uniref:Fumarylacetoacetate hydrolase family protein n=1 Tax=Nocardioides dubius TaxID=317019 RepID=A0ABP4E7M9_9ACTN